MTTVPATYCPDCGTPLSDRRIEGRDRRYCTDCERVVWHTPVPAAGVAVVGSDGVLCGRRGIDPGRGEWAVPGGHMEAGEAPAETAVRELREEVGLVADPDSLQMVGTHSPSFADGKHMTVLDYAVPRRAVDGTPDPGPEVAAVEWVHPDAIHDVPGRSFLAHHDEILQAAWALLGEA